MSTNPLENCTEADLKRFAACWLNSDRSETNWEAAAQQYDSKVQVASFKTVTGRAAVKVLKGTSAEGDAKPTKKAAGGKRKKAADEDDGNADEEKPKAKRGARAKKAKSPAAVTEEEDDATKEDDIKPAEEEEDGIKSEDKEEADDFV